MVYGVVQVFHTPRKLDGVGCKVLVIWVMQVANVIWQT